MLQNLTFLHPLILLLLLLWPIIVFFLFKSDKKNAIVLASSDEIGQVYGNWSIISLFKYLLLSAIYIFFVFILAGIVNVDTKENTKKNGIDIVLALDISSSMEANDFQPNRLEGAKKVLTDFIATQKTNRVGLIVFAGKPFTSIPLTYDYSILQESIGNLQTKTINQNYFSGTAIGDAILMGKNLFEEDKREKVIILLTDGEANIGVDPNLAARSAKQEDIKVYTIGIGSEEGGTITQNIGPFAKKVQMPPLNDSSLKEISSISGANYYRATDNNALEYIFQDLEKLEKNELEVQEKKLFQNYNKELSIIIFVLIVVYILLNNLFIFSGK